MKQAAIFAILYASSLFGQYYVESFAGRLGPAPGTLATETPIHANQLLGGPAGEVWYSSYQQLVQIDATGRIGQVLGPNDLRFDLADGGDRDYIIIVASSSADGSMYLLDATMRLLRIEPGGRQTVFALPPPKRMDAQLNMAAARDGIVYWANGDNLIQRIDLSTGKVQIVAGNGIRPTTPASDGTPATSAAIFPLALAVDQNGKVYFSEGQLIRTWDAAGLLVTVADFSGAGRTPYPLVAAPDGTLLVGIGQVVHRIDPLTGGDSVIESITDAFVFPVSMSQDGLGNVYVSLGTKINVVDNGGTVALYAGTGSSADSGESKAIDSAQLAVNRMAVGRDGRIYGTEAGQNGVRLFDRVGRTTQVIADPVLDLPVFTPFYNSVVVDGRQNVIYSDDCRVRMLHPVTGAIQTIATCRNQGGQFPYSIAALAVDSFDRIYVMTTDHRNHEIWRIDPGTGDMRQVVPRETLAPFFANFVPPYSLIFGSDQRCLAVDKRGNIYWSDTFFGGLVRITPDGVATVVAGDSGSAINHTLTSQSVNIWDMSLGDDDALYLALGDSIARFDFNQSQLQTIAGPGRLDETIYGGDGGPALDARVSAYTIAAGGGSVYFSDGPLVRRLYVPATESLRSNAIR